ncbi:MAG: 23S rRNA (adenine(2503)-C(2))-methyltransferase RlmN [Spirochaetia bacterium]
MQPLPLTGYLPEQICRVFDLSPPYRGRQIFQAVWKEKAPIGEMTALPKIMRERLETETSSSRCSVENRIEDEDGTLKLVVRCPGAGTSDTVAVETVILTDGSGRRTACVSTQAGCAMGCGFCKTGTLGLVRNLYAYEITEQFRLAEENAGSIDSLVFMGMGEPLANLEEVRRAIAILSHPLGMEMSLRRMTVSTCGLVEGIGELSREGPKVRLAVSLITAEQKIREGLMPIARNNPLDALQAALAAYRKAGGKRITLEYVLIPGVNDTEKAVRALESFVRPLKAVVNVIPWNPVPGLDYKPPEAGQIETFLARLEAANITYTRRYTRGRGIGGACGQLGSSLKKLLD